MKVPICGYGNVSKNNRSKTSQVILGANLISEGIFNSKLRVALMLGLGPLSKG